LGIFKRRAALSQGKIGQLYRIRITTADGKTLYWHKRGRLHVVEEDVAHAFLQRFNPALFQVTAAGSFESPGPGTHRVAKLDMERV
jgi:hypothetical protein